MRDIEMQEMSAEFLKCWQAAGIHLSKQVQGGIQSWIRAHPYPPFLEHLSFRLGNQVFFVRVEDVERRVHGPGSLDGLVSIADGCKGHACLLPMKRAFHGGEWVADNSRWGLLDARTKARIDPVQLVSDERIEMTNWELHDFAVQVVRTQLEKQGYQMTSWQGDPGVDPAIWFIGDSKRPEWVVVRAVRYPQSEIHRPANWNAIAAGCAQMSAIGHFAPVAFVSADQPFKGENEAAVPLWRGYGVHVRYVGFDSD